MDCSYRTVSYTYFLRCGISGVPFNAVQNLMKLDMKSGDGLQQISIFIANGAGILYLSARRCLYLADRRHLADG